MMGGRLNAGTMAPATSDVDFGYAPMQSYVGGSFEPGMIMPGDRPPLLQAHHHLYDSLDFASAAAAFPFQEPSLFAGSAANNNLQQQTFSPQITMPMAPSPSMQLPMMTLPGVPTAGCLATDAYGHYGGGGGGFLKREDGPFEDVGGGGGGGRIGLNLGRRTYFSPADVLAVDRLLMRSRFGGAGAMGVLGLGLGAAHHHQPPRCQAEGCKADLSAAKHYHRRHKVCEYHAKAASVAAAGKQQRFCQQCSRFHVLGEFDEAKRSCRKRLTEHNRRRRKPAGAVQAKDSPLPSKKAEASMTSSYTSDHKNNNRSTAISPNASGLISCLLEVDNGQSSNATTAAPTTLSLAAPPPQTHDRDGALDTMLMQRHVVQRRDEQQQQQFMMTSLVQSQQQQHHHHHHQGNSSGGNGNILSCSSASDHQNDSSCCNGGSNGNGNGHGMQHFFEVDFM